MSDELTFFSFFKYFFSAFTSLIPIVNPFSTVPLLLALTTRMTQTERQRQGDRACRNAAIILIIGLFLGAFILEFFNISISALRIAGGLIISVIGLNMLFPKNTRHSGDAAEADNTDKNALIDYSVIPLALPSLSGAGSLALIMTFSTRISAEPTILRKSIGYLVIVLAILAVAGVSFLVLRSARWIQNYLGPQGINALTRIMGLLMVCIGIQFIADGTLSFIQSNIPVLQSPAQ